MCTEANPLILMEFTRLLQTFGVKTFTEDVTVISDGRGFSKGAVNFIETLLLRSLWLELMGMEW